MNPLSKFFMLISAMILMTTMVPVREVQASIFEGTVTEEGVAFGICRNDPENELCAGIDCDSEDQADNPLCISETEAGTGLAKESLTGTGITHTDNFGDYIKKLVNFALPYITLAAFVGYVVAGFLYVTAFGNDDQIGKAKKILIWASAGLILVILSYAITNLFTGQLVQDLQEGQQ